MKRRAILFLSAASLAMSLSAALADTFSNDIVSQLTRQGFAGIQTETTWLGRVRIVASRADGTREIIVNPRSGEILRDLWTAADGVKTSAPIVDDVGEATSLGIGGTSPGGTSPGGTTPGGTGSNGSSPGSGDGAEHGGSPGSPSGSGSGGGDDGGSDH